MQPGTIAIVLVAAVAHAVWNLASKYKRGDTYLFVWAYTCISALFCVPLGIALMVKNHQPLDWRLAVSAAVSASLHMAYSLTLQAGYDRAELGVVYPVARGTGPLITMLFAVILLGERLTEVSLLGAFLIVAGIGIFSGHAFGRSKARPLQGVLWGSATGATIAGYTLWDSFSVTSWHLAPVSYYAGTLLLQGLMLTPIALRRGFGIRSAVRVDARPILIVAVFSPLAYVLVLTAMVSAPVALVAPLRESSIVVASFVAYVLFREGNLARRMAGAVVVLCGIVAISL